ncbi:MAG: flagellar hook-length control protein FliK [Ignavibacteriales bacterium]|nr:flagellar hook-length control protein FliK [Ignavibacteriales bacterium]
MIFNPLFINENGSNQFLVTKPGKLSNNKYLFSDIVKVVMNPSEEPKNPLNINLENLNGKIKINSNSDQKPVQLTFKYLSDTDNEQAKYDLADLLPEDIAKLLISEDAVPNEEKAISYISKEPLKGELQNFLYNLVGAEIIEKNINNNSGLLLSMEDTKSAVNVELVKDFDGKKADDKIMVQTLVVPEKSKLLSAISNTQNRDILFKMNSNNDELLSSPMKPTLSVYSFKSGNDELESIAKSFQSNLPDKTANFLVNSNNFADLKSESQKLPLDKISFIPGEVKKVTSNKGKIDFGAKLQDSANKSDLKLLNTNQENRDKDFSVSKITIVKKQSDLTLVDNLKEKNSLTKDVANLEIKNNETNAKVNKSAKLHLLSNLKESSDLKKINFKDQKVVAEKNEKLKTVNIKSNNSSAVQNSKGNENSNSKENNFQNVENKSSNLKAINSSEISKKENPTNKVENSKNVAVSNEKQNNNIKTQNTVEELEKTIKELKVKSNPESNLKQNSDQRIQSNSKDEMVKNQFTTTEENVKVNQTKEKVNEIEIPKNIAKSDVSSEKVKETSKENIVTQGNSKNEDQIKSKDIKTDLPNTKNQNVIDANNGKSVKVNDRSTTEIKADQEISNQTQETNIEEGEHREKNLTEKKIEIKQENKTNENVKSPEQKIVTQVPLNVIEPEKTELNANKKISVKIKGEVKSINGNDDSKNIISEEKSSTNNTQNQRNEDSEQNLNNTFKSSTILNSQSEHQIKSENIFHNVINKEIDNTPHLANSKFSDVENHNHRIVKSVEVIKEITNFISKQEKGSLSLEIRPEHLGKMKITLDTADNILKGRIEVDSEQSKQLIERNLDKLHSQLSENGIQLSSLNISLGNPKQKNEKMGNGESNKNNRENVSSEIDETKDEQQKKSLGYNTYEYIA